MSSYFNENTPRFSIECVVRDCKSSYKSVESLRKHVQRHRSEVLKVSVVSDSDVGCSVFMPANHCDMECSAEFDNTYSYENDLSASEDRMELLSHCRRYLGCLM
jgi:hypothetical protein